MAKQLPSSHDSGPWFKCPHCEMCWSQRDSFLMHIASHSHQQRQITHGHDSQANKPIFYTATGQVLRINELPNTYEIFTPKIKLKTLEAICRASKVNIQLPNIKLSRLTEEDIKAAYEEANKRKFRVKPRKSYTDFYNDEGDLRNSNEEELEFEGLDEEDEDYQEEILNNLNPEVKKKRKYKKRKYYTNKNGERVLVNVVNRAERIPCKQCGKSYSREYMENHLDVHKREAQKSNPFRCILCNKGFLLQAQLKDHFVLHLENNPFTCDFPGCDHRSKSQSNLKIHMKLHYGPPEVFPCEICNIEYSREYRLIAHNREFHSTDAVPNEQVPSTYTRGRRLLRHRHKRLEDLSPARKSLPIHLVPAQPMLSEFTNESSSTCRRVYLDSLHLGDDDTIKSESREALLDVKEELEIQEIDKPQPDTSLVAEKRSAGTGPNRSIDDTVFLTDPVVQRLSKENPEFVKLLSSKYTTCGDSRAFRCKICVYPEIAFSRHYLLQTHMKKHHPEDTMTNQVGLSSTAELMLTCGSCGFQSKSSARLARHMKTHRTKQFHCTVCGSFFETQIKLDRHIPFHMEKPHKCNKCNKAFAKKDFLRRHDKHVHPPPPENPEDLICKHCGKMASSIIALRTHTRLHEQNRVFSYCKICNDKLSNKGSLRRHILLVHSKTMTAPKKRKKTSAPVNEDTSIHTEEPESALFL